LSGGSGPIPAGSSWKPCEKRTAWKRNYYALDNQGKANERRLAEFLTRNGQQLLPMVDLIAQSRMAIDDLVDTVGAGNDRGGAAAVCTRSGRSTTLSREFSSAPPGADLQSVGWSFVETRA